AGEDGPVVVDLPVRGDDAVEPLAVAVQVIERAAGRVRVEADVPGDEALVVPGHVAGRAVDRAVRNVIAVVEVDVGRARTGVGDHVARLGLVSDPELTGRAGQTVEAGRDGHVTGDRRLPVAVHTVQDRVEPRRVRHPDGACIDVVVEHRLRDSRGGGGLCNQRAPLYGVGDAVALVLEACAVLAEEVLPAPLLTGIGFGVAATGERQGHCNRSGPGRDEQRSDDLLHEVSPYG